MKNTKRLPVPFSPGLELLGDRDFFTRMEKSGQRFYVEEVNWPDQYPYAPVCAGSIARSFEHICLSFHVRGFDLRSLNTADNERQWEDSTCEFFVADPEGGVYYNFEENCIGTITAASGAGRQGRIPRPAQEMAKIIRHTSLKGKEGLDIRGESEIYSFDIGMCVPMRLLGVDPDNLPVRLMGNFYKCGDLTGHPHFLSWNRVSTPKPDFHRPEFFGELILK